MAMRKRRFVMLLVSGVVAAGLTAVVVGFCWPQLPDPATADRDGLLRWLVTQDLGQQPAETLLVLARRLEQEFGGKIDWADVGRSLDGRQKDRLWDNVVLLLEPWFADKVDGYFRLLEPQRPAYIDRTLQLIENWKGATVLSAGSRKAGSASRRAGSAGRQESAGTPGPTGLIETLIERIGQWTESATPLRRQQIHEFLLAIQSRWLQGALFGPSSTQAF
jgi:hypothetical protein